MNKFTVVLIIVIIAILITIGTFAILTNTWLGFGVTAFCTIASIYLIESLLAESFNPKVIIKNMF